MQVRKTKYLLGLTAICKKSLDYINSRYPGATILLVSSLSFGMCVAINAALQDGKYNQNGGHGIFHCIPEIFRAEFILFP